MALREDKRSGVSALVRHALPNHSYIRDPAGRSARIRLTVEGWLFWQVDCPGRSNSTSQNVNVSKVRVRY